MSDEKPTQKFTQVMIRLLHQIRHWWYRTPLTALILFTIVSVTAKENYPFSHFPMYSNPSPTRDFTSVTDGNGNAIPLAKLTGITAPKVGKILRSKRESRGRKLKINHKNLPENEVQAIANEIFQFLRQQAAVKGNTLPDSLQLRKTYISFADGNIVEKPEILAQEAPGGASAPLPPTNPADENSANDGPDEAPPDA